MTRTDITNTKGEFKVDLKASDNPGKYDIKAEFSGDAQYKSSDSSVKITVEETKVTSQQKTTVTTNQDNTDEEQKQMKNRQTNNRQTNNRQTNNRQTNNRQMKNLKKNLKKSR